MTKFGALAIDFERDLVPVFCDNDTVRQQPSRRGDTNDDELSRASFSFSSFESIPNP